MARGRGAPTKYKKAYCQRVIDLMSEGKSMAHLAAELGVPRCQIYEWADKNPEFLDALTLGKELAEQWWQEKGMQGMEKSPSEFQNGVWKFFMANRFGWSDKSEQKHDINLSYEEKLRQLDAGDDD